MTKDERENMTQPSPQSSKEQRSRTAPALTPEEEEAIDQMMMGNINRNNKRDQELLNQKGR